MLRPYRPSFENLEKREVFSTGLLIGLGNVGDRCNAPTEACGLLLWWHANWNECYVACGPAKDAVRADHGNTAVFMV